jgi:hypothetical protein
MTQKERGGSSGQRGRRCPSGWCYRLFAPADVATTQVHVQATSQDCRKPHRAGRRRSHESDAGRPTRRHQTLSPQATRLL